MSASKAPGHMSRSPSHVDGRAPKVELEATSSAAQPSILNLQRNIGNRAVSQGLQLRDADNNSSHDTIPPIVRSVLSSGRGQPLDAHTRTFMESRFGQDFSRVRVHGGPDAASAAEAINAVAFTAGQDIVFGAGQFSPENDAGRLLLAHELTHTIQQDEYSAEKIAEREVISPGDQTESDANRTAQMVVSGIPVNTGSMRGMAGPKSIQREPAPKAAAGGLVDRLVRGAMEEIDRSDKSYRVLLQIVLVARNNHVLKALADALSKRPHPPDGTYLDALVHTLLTEGGKESRDFVLQLLGREGVHREADPRVVNMNRSAKLKEAALLGAPEIAPEILDQIVSALPWMVGIWIASHFVGIGELVDLLGVAFLGKQAVEAVGDLLDYYNLAKDAQNEGDLRAAGGHLAKALASVGVAGIFAILGAAKKKSGRPIETEGVRKSSGEHPSTTGKPEIPPAEKLPAQQPPPEGGGQGQTTTTAREVAAKPPQVAAARTDVSGQYKFRKYEKGGKTYKQACGRLGDPDSAIRHRDPAAQRRVAGGTGEDAGHLIGDRFGAPGGPENLNPQNWKQNRFGTYKDLENSWAAKRRSGIEIDVQVTDVTKGGEARPYRRNVQWTETTPEGTQTSHELDFVNTHTPESRAKQGLAPRSSGEEAR